MSQRNKNFIRMLSRMNREAREEIDRRNKPKEEVIGVRRKNTSPITGPVDMYATILITVGPLIALGAITVALLAIAGII